VNGVERGQKKAGQSDPVMRDIGIVVDVIRHNLANAHIRPCLIVPVVE